MVSVATRILPTATKEFLEANPKGCFWRQRKTSSDRVFARKAAVRAGIKEGYHVLSVDG